MEKPEIMPDNTLYMGEVERAVMDVVEKVFLLAFGSINCEFFHSGDVRNSSTRKCRWPSTGGEECLDKHQYFIYRYKGKMQKDCAKD
jgi:hypothetical protein